MPVAHAGETKYAYLDHDTDVVDEMPPILNQWYTVFDAEDVRLLWCIIMQDNDEAAVKNVEVRWTIDGNVYWTFDGVPAATEYYVYRYYGASDGGTDGLLPGLTVRNAGGCVDKRGHSFKVEVRIISALGTLQVLRCYCVRETLEQT